LRQLGGQLGVPDYDVASVPHLVKLLIERGCLATSSAEGIERFWSVRSQVVGSQSLGVSGDVLAKAASEGSTLLRLVQDIPRERYLVGDMVHLYRDRELTETITGVSGVTIETYSHGSNSPYRRVFPTRMSYRRGALVSWLWDKSAVIGPAWYRDERAPRIASFDRSYPFAGKEL
jgi:hypothetical protein